MVFNRHSVLCQEKPYGMTPIEDLKTTESIKAQY